MQGRIQDSLMGVHIYKGGFNLLILLDLLFFPDFLKILHKKSFVSKGGSSKPLEPRAWTPFGSATLMLMTTIFWLPQKFPWHNVQNLASQ